MIEIQNLSHTLGQKKVLSEISLVIPNSAIVGLIGVNGAGKSTLLRLLAGVYKPDEGTVLYDGRSPECPTVRQELFFLPDEPYYTAQSSGNSLFALYKTFYPTVDRQTFEALLSHYQIQPSSHIRNYSKGMRRQLFIALALSIKPKYLLLDEAFDGLDPLSRKIFKEALVSLVEENGTTVLIASHSLRELEDFCDRFVLLDENRIAQQGHLDEHVERLCKFELAFRDEIPRSAFSSLPVVSLVIKGRFAQIVLEGESAAMRQALEALAPAVIEERAVDFEEAFLHDVEKNRGDTV